MCAEAAKHDAEVEVAKAELRKCMRGTPDSVYWTGHENYHRTAAHTSRKAHEQGKCSCFVRMRVNADRKKRGLDPL